MLVRREARKFNVSSQKFKKSGKSCVIQLIYSKNNVLSLLIGTTHLGSFAEQVK